MINTRSSRGSALLSALFIMTLVAIAATAMISRLQLDIYRTRTNITSDKLNLASDAVTFWAMGVLATQTQPFLSKNASGRILQFPIVLQHLYPNMVLTGEIIDLQSRFNLNNLENNVYQAAFMNLLKATVKGVSNDQCKQLMIATSRWISANQQTITRDEFLDLYLKQSPAYIPAYQPMKNSSELRMVNGFTARIYQQIEPYVTALPEITPININTASTKIIMLLGQGLTTAQAKELVNARGEKGMTNLESVSPMLQKLDIAADQITLESRYFLSVATASAQEQQLTHFTLLKRDKDKKGKITIQVLGTGQK